MYALLLLKNGRSSLESRSSLSMLYKKSNIMIKIEFSFCVRERLSEDCEKVQQRRILVRGHFRVSNGKKVYVKTHYRKK